MKIALLGYGKMGKAIEQIAVQKGHAIGYISRGELNIEELKDCDIAIDFSVPSAAFRHISSCLKNNIPIVSGTTGWLEKYEEAARICEEQKGAFLYAPNFSPGVNLFFELNQRLAKMMGNFPLYSVGIEEIHHTEKVDSPSGTAIGLAQQIIDNSSKTNWELTENLEKINKDQNTVPIRAKRIPNVPGTHVVKYSSEIDDIELKHTAHSREGFAAGAVMAAEWIQGKTGVFEMKDVLKDVFL